MFAHVARRVLLMVPMLFAVSLLAFTLVELSDPGTGVSATTQSTSDGQAAERARLYLDRPVAQRYWLWLTGIGGHGDIGLLQGEWGPSTRSADHDIGGEFGSRLLVTVRLALVAVFQGFGLAVLAGVFGALLRSRFLDRVLTLLGLLALSTPTYWLATTLGETEDRAGYLVLPALVLTLSGYAVTFRYQRAAMSSVLDSSHVRLARAKGLRHWTVVWRYALPAALIPVARSTRWVLTGAFSGVILVEAAFGWRGFGGYLVDAVTEGDTYAVMGWLVLAATVVVIVSVVVDLWYSRLDPRIRYE